MAESSDKFDYLFDRLALSEIPSDASDRDKFYHRVAIERAREILRWDADASNRELFEIRIRLALHLSPRNAVAYDSANPTPRWKLIRAYITERFCRDPADGELLARDVQEILDNWDRDRSSVTGHLNFLMKRDGPMCQNCRVPFQDQSEYNLEEDEYKPYHHAPKELLRPEVDHVDAISGLGTNILSNLQLLCRLCNAGKGRGLGLSVEDEARYAGMAISEIPVAHRGRMLYYVIQRDSRKCQECKGADQEVTIRPASSLGSYVRTNLRTLCRRCATSRRTL